MHLDNKTHNIIKTEVANQLGNQAVVGLFGSRVIVSIGEYPVKPVPLF